MAKKNRPIIVIIGAASTTFGPKVLRDIINHPQLDGSTFRFVDVHEQRLEVYDRLARRIARQIDHSVRIESDTDRKKMLRGADYVIISAEVGRYELWEQDFAIPVKHGVRQVMLLDPVVDSVRTAERVLDEMLKTQAQYLPQFG